MSTQKPRVFTSYDKLGTEIKNKLKLKYPEGFSHELINFYDKDGVNVSALIFETDEKILLIKMSQTAAEKIIFDDEDYDDDGLLKEAVKESLEEEFMENEDEETDDDADTGKDDMDDDDYDDDDDDDDDDEETEAEEDDEP
jgi:phosphopantothenoylcysteine synthetase/decarboxylase